MPRKMQFFLLSGTTWFEHLRNLCYPEYNTLTRVFRDIDLNFKFIGLSLLTDVPGIILLYSIKISDGCGQIYWTFYSSKPILLFFCCRLLHLPGQMGLPNHHRWEGERCNSRNIHSARRSTQQISALCNGHHKLTNVGKVVKSCVYPLQSLVWRYVLFRTYGIFFKETTTSHYVWFSKGLYVKTIAVCDFLSAVLWSYNGSSTCINKRGILFIGNIFDKRGSFPPFPPVSSQ